MLLWSVPFRRYAHLVGRCPTGLKPKTCNFNPRLIISIYIFTGICAGYSSRKVESYAQKYIWSGMGGWRKKHFEKKHFERNKIKLRLAEIALGRNCAWLYFSPPTLYDWSDWGRGYITDSIIGRTGRYRLYIYMLPAIWTRQVAVQSKSYYLNNRT